MAKFRKTEEEPQEEMTVVVLRLKGGSGTLQKSLDAVSQALAGMGAPALPAPRRPTAHQLPNGNGNTNGNGAEPIDIDGDADEEAEETITTTRTSSGARGPRKYNFLTDFDLNGDGTSFKTFAAQKGPSTNDDKHLVAALWLEKHGGRSNFFTIHHVFTCFRDVGWDAEGDFGHPMRKMKKEKSFYTTPKFGQWKLTKPGTDAAEAVKPKA